MGLEERIEDLTGLLIALSIYLIIRWAQRRWPDPPRKNGQKKSKLEELPSEEDLLGEEE